MLLSRVTETVRRYGMFEPGSHIAVAVSGGADSVCLLHLLRELTADWELRLTVLHLNHRLRGAESDGDEQFVRDLAGKLGLPATVRAMDVADVGGNLEQAGREARRAFFKEVLASGEIDRIAVAHTRNDQAETVLFRFLRGSGGAGLAAIRPVTADGIVRPLLESGREEVEAYLRQRAIPWRRDSSNDCPQFARNRIRHQLLPQLAREWNPAIVETLARSADWALAEEEYWENEIGRFTEGLIERNGTVMVPVQLLRGFPRAVARRVVRHVLARTKGDLRRLGFGHVSAVLDMAAMSSGHAHLHLPGVDAVRSFDWLRFAPAGQAGYDGGDYRLAAPVPGSLQVPGSEITIRLELIEKSETLGSADCVYNEETGFIDWRALSGRLELRNWRPGDRYQPQGSTGEEKIKILFQKARIPYWERRRWPVLTDGSAIVWARQFGPATPFAAGPECTVRLRIREVGTP